MDIDTTSPFIRICSGDKGNEKQPKQPPGTNAIQDCCRQSVRRRTPKYKKVTVIHPARSSVEMRVRDESGRECNKEGADSKSVWSVTVQNPVDELDTDSWPRWASPGSNCMA